MSSGRRPRSGSREPREPREPGQPRQPREPRAAPRRQPRATSRQEPRRRRQEPRAERGRGSDLLLRVLVAIPAAILVVVFVNAGGWPFVAFISAIGCICAYELYRMLHRWRPVPLVGFAAIIGMAMTSLDDDDGRVQELTATPRRGARDAGDSGGALSTARRKAAAATRGRGRRRAGGSGDGRGVVARRGEPASGRPRSAGRRHRGGVRSVGDRRRRVPAGRPRRRAGPTACIAARPAASCRG